MASTNKNKESQVICGWMVRIQWSLILLKSKQLSEASDQRWKHISKFQPPHRKMETKGACGTGMEWLQPSPSKALKYPNRNGGAGLLPFSQLMFPKNFVGHVYFLGSFSSLLGHFSWGCLHETHFAFTKHFPFWISQRYV